MTLVTELVIGLSLGAVYALLAAGVTVVYQAARLPNVAVVAIGTVAAVLHGDLMSTDGRFGSGLGWWPALGVSVALAALLGLGCERLTRGLREQIVPGLVALLGISALLLAGVNAVWGSEAKFLPPPWAGDAFRRGDLQIDRSDVATILVAVAAGLALLALSRVTRSGLALRAQASDLEGSRMAGIDPAAVNRLAWVVSSALGAVAMTLVLHPVLSNTYETTVYVALAVAAAAAGGFRSLPRAAAAGVILGVVPSVFDTSGSRFGGFGNLVAFLLLAGVFFRRPGAIGRPALDEIFASASADNAPSAVRGRAAGLPAPLALPAWAGRAGVVAVAAALAVAVPLLSSDVALEAWARGIAVFLISMSVVIVFGWTGDIALGQVAFAGIGAYLVGALAVRAGLPHLAAIPLAVLLTLPYAVAVGIPAFRSRGRMAFAALSLLGMVTAATLLWGPGARWFTLPLAGLRRPGWMEALSGRPAVSYYLVALSLAGAVVWFATNLRRSRVGRALAAGRDSDVAGRSLGIDPAHYRLVALCFAGAVAALGGIVLAYGARPPDPTRFAVFLSVQYFLYAVVGGARSLAGTAVVVFAFEVAPALDRGAPPSGPTGVLLLGGLAVLTMAFAPGGLAGIVRAVAARLAPAPGVALAGVGASGFTGARPSDPSDLDPFADDPAGEGRFAHDPFGEDPFADGPYGEDDPFTGDAWGEDPFAPGASAGETNGGDGPYGDGPPGGEASGGGDGPRGEEGDGRRA